MYLSYFAPQVKQTKNQLQNFTRKFLGDRKFHVTCALKFIGNFRKFYVTIRIVRKLILHNSLSKMKAEPSQLIPQKPTENPKLVNVFTCVYYLACFFESGFLSPCLRIKHMFLCVGSWLQLLLCEYGNNAIDQNYLYWFTFKILGLLCVSSTCKPELRLYYSVRLSESDMLTKVYVFSKLKL